jgi:hypothetical protein
MGQTQGGVRVRTLRLGKATLLFDGARGVTGFAGIEGTKGQPSVCA